MWPLESSSLGNQRPLTDLVFCVILFPTEQKLLLEQKHFAALSSEWLNNSWKSDSSSPSWGFCLSNDMTHGHDTLKPLLWFRICTLKRTEESGSAWQMVSLNCGPKHLRDVAKSFSQWGWIAKTLSWKNFGQSSEVIFPFWGSDHLIDGVWQKIQHCDSEICF